MRRAEVGSVTISACPLGSLCRVLARSALGARNNSRPPTPHRCFFGQAWEGPAMFGGVGQSGQLHRRM